MNNLNNRRDPEVDSKFILNHQGSGELTLRPKKRASSLGIDILNSSQRESSSQEEEKYNNPRE